MHIFINNFPMKRGPGEEEEEGEKVAEEEEEGEKVAEEEEDWMMRGTKKRRKRTEVVAHW